MKGEAMTYEEGLAAGERQAEHKAEVARNTHTHEHPSKVYYSHSHPYYEPHSHSWYGPQGDTFGHDGPLSESDALTQGGEHYADK